MDKTWYLDSFNGILNPISAVRTMCDSIRTNARRDGMGAIEDSGRKLYDLCNDMEHQIRATINLMNFSKDHGITSSTVYSDSFDEMIQKDFTYKGNKYTWNDLDCVYYNDNGDEEDFFMEIPKGAITSAKKPIKSALELNSHEAIDLLYDCEPVEFISPDEDLRDSNIIIKWLEDDEMYAIKCEPYNPELTKYFSSPEEVVNFLLDKHNGTFYEFDGLV